MSLTVNENLFRIYVKYCLILVLKMIFISVYTTFERFRYLAFDNIEDSVPLQVEVKREEDVEKVKRSHLNDMENIPIFFLIGFFYILTNPTEEVAGKLFLVYTISRIVYTIVSAIFILPQPARLLSYMVGFGIQLYLILKCVQFYTFGHVSNSILV